MPFAVKNNHRLDLVILSSVVTSQSKMLLSVPFVIRAGGVVLGYLPTSRTNSCSLLPFCLQCVTHTKSFSDNHDVVGPDAQVKIPGCSCLLKMADCSILIAPLRHKREAFG